MLASGEWVLAIMILGAGLQSSSGRGQVGRVAGQLMGQMMAGGGLGPLGGGWWLAE